MNETLIQITSPYYCAGLVVVEGYITEAAPILHWTVGRQINYVTAYFQKKGFEVNVLHP